MLPYLAPPKLVIGHATLYLFGFLVGAGGTIGVQMASERARTLGLVQATMRWLLLWVVVGGFVGGHVIDLLVYEPQRVLRDPASLLRIWETMGSFGGFAGTAVGALTFFAVARVDRRLAYADAIAWAFPVAWCIGRVGCALAYDHVGRPTSFFLGQRYVDRVVRHNLGLEEALFTAVLAGLFLVAGRVPRREGFFLGWMLVAYAPFRFFLDYLRIEDVRYRALTPAQYGSIVLGLAGLVFLARRSSPAPTAGVSSR